MSGPSGLEGTSSRVFLQEQVLLAQLTGVKPGETIRELDDIQAQLSCITGSGSQISHLSSQSPQISHLSSQSPHISHLSSQSPSPSPHISQLSSQPPSQSPHILHLTSQTSHLSSQSPSHSPHISHLSSPSHSPHISHLSQSPSQSPHISHLSSQSPSHSPHISHLSRSPSHSPHISHLSQSPAHSPHISHLSQSPSHSPHISHLSQSPSNSPHISHLSSQPSQIDLLDERTPNSDVISGPRVVIDNIDDIDEVVPHRIIVEDHNGVIDERHGVIIDAIDANARTSDLSVEHTGDDLSHKHVLYQTNESRTKAVSVSDCKAPSTIENHADALDEILDNVGQEETRVVIHQPVLLNRDQVLSRLNEAEKFISSCYRDVVLVTMDDPTNRPFLNVFSKYPDKFLYDQSSLRMNVKMSDDMKLFCEVLTNNRELVREAAVDNIEIDIKAIMDDLNEARYQSCVGLPSEGHDTILQKIRKSDIQNLLLEKYNGSLIYRARDCRFVVDCKIGETLHCMQCRIMGVELDEKYSKTRALADFVVPDDAVEEELGGTLVNKRRRGRPKGSKNKLKSEVVDFKEEPEESTTMFGDILDLPEDDDPIEDGSEIVRRVDLEAGMISSGLIGHAIDDEVLLNPIVEVKEDPVTNYHINQTGDDSVRVGPALDSKRGKKKKILSRRQISSKAGRVGRKPKIALPVHCPEEGCNLSFDLIRDYKVHALEHTNTFPCSQATCIKRFKSKSDLEAHERKHRGEKPYSCTECGKSYATKQDLRLHFRKHTGERPYSCDDCGKQFARKAALRIHRVSVHENVKSFLCPECGAAFKANSALIDHRKRVHLQIKPHSCEFCGKEFFSRKDYGEHTRTHTGEKPFQCQLCGKCFGRGYHLKRHVDGVHRGPGLIGPDGQPIPGVLLPVISGDAVYRKPQTIRKIKVVQSGAAGSVRPSSTTLEASTISSTSLLQASTISSSSLPTSAALVPAISFTASPTFDLKALTLATDVKNFIQQQRLDTSESALQRLDTSQPQTIEIKAFPSVSVAQDIKPFSGLADIKPYAPLDLAQRHPSIELEGPQRPTPTSSPHPPAATPTSYAPYVPATSQHPSHYLAMAHYYRTSQDTDHFVQNAAEKFS